MNFRETRLTLKIMAEDRIGAPRYHNALAARQHEDAVFAAGIPKVN